MPDEPKPRFDPFKHKVLGPLLIVGFLVGGLFSAVAVFYFISKR